MCLLFVEFQGPWSCMPRIFLVYSPQSLFQGGLCLNCGKNKKGHGPACPTTSKNDPGEENAKSAVNTDRGNKADNKKEACPKCGKLLMPKSIQKHMSSSACRMPETSTSLEVINIKLRRAHFH